MAGKTGAAPAVERRPARPHTMGLQGGELPCGLKGCGTMSRLLVEGPTPLAGEIRVQGAKNSALPILTSALLCDSPSVVHNCPDLLDVEASCGILRHLGCGVRREGQSVFIDPAGVSKYDVPDALMREMRSSIVFLGAICAKLGRARISFPGGCELGPRPIDLHLAALRQLGVRIEEDHGWLNCRVEDGLRGANIMLSFPSVGATENIMLAAATARGTTTIVNAAREPEIGDLAAFLNACGGDVRGAGESTVVVEGVRALHGCEHEVIADRIAAATYMAAAAATGGSLRLTHLNLRHLTPLLPVFEEAGCALSSRAAPQERNADTLEISRRGKLGPVRSVRTMPYPGFPTDAQAPAMAMAALADGISIFIENIFENRYKHASELVRMGAKIKLEGKVAIVEGVPKLYGAQVEATDLRGGAALVAAGMAAEGETVVSGVHHIDRGYESIETALSSLGAKIRRIGDADAPA